MHTVRHALKTVLLFGAVAVAGIAAAHSYQLGALTIGHPWARATAPGQPTGGGYLKLTNGGTQADRLVSASSPAAKSVQMHAMSMEGDVMRMRQLQAVDVPPGQTVELKPGGTHLMLTGLTRPLKAGDSVPLTLRFEKAGTVDVQLKIESTAPAEAGASAGGHADMAGHDHH